MSKNINESFKDRIVINDSPNESGEILRQRSNETENQTKK